MLKKFKKNLSRSVCEIIVAVIVLTLLLVFGYFLMNNTKHEYIKFVLYHYDLYIGLLTAYFAYKTLKYTLFDLLDSKSEWRKKIYDIASKEKWTMDDVFRLRASLRLIKKNDKWISIDNCNENNSKQINCFDDFSDACIVFFDKKINEYYKYKTENKEIDMNKIITIKDQKLIRIICMFMLKNHWEYHASLTFFNIFLGRDKDRHNSKPQDIIDKTLKEIIDINSGKK